LTVYFLTLLYFTYFIKEHVETRMPSFAVKATRTERSHRDSTGARKNYYSMCSQIAT